MCRLWYNKLLNIQIVGNQMLHEYDEVIAKATEFNIMLKARARNKDCKTPYETGAFELTQISYMHNLDKDSITIMVCYDSNQRLYTYICDDNIICVEMIEMISKQMSKDYTETKALELMTSNELLF